MISAKILFKHFEKFTLDNSPVILTAVGAAGTVGTAFLAAQASWKANDLVDAENERRLLMNEKVVQGPKEVAKIVWKEYIPAAGVGVMTIASIICANRISTKRVAAMAAAYSLSEKAYGEYREKVIEKFNANKERQVRDEVAQDRVTANPPKDAQIIITGSGDVLCHDLPTGRYFKSNIEKLRSVQNDLNAAVNEIGYATLSDFYVALNLATTPYSEELGWTTSELLELHFSAVLTDDNQPCISINYHAHPLRHNKPFRGCDEDPPF